MINNKNNLISLTRPYALDGNLKRYGPNSDGGYITNSKYIDLCDTLYTYGVGNDIAFEIDLLKQHPNYNIHLYDHTSLVTISIGNEMNFHKEGLALDKSEDCDNFINHVVLNNDLDKKILLKIDIDGYELEFFKKVNIFDFSNVVQLIIEFHIEQDSNIKDMEEALKNINKCFYCFHVHQNDHRGLLNVGEQKFPLVSEITFINKNYINFTPEFKNTKYPIEGIDYSNGGQSEKWEIEYK